MRPLCVTASPVPRSSLSRRHCVAASVWMSSLAVERSRPPHPPMTVRMRCIPSLHLIFVCPAIQGILDAAACMYFSVRLLDGGSTWTSSSRSLPLLALAGRGGAGLPVPSDAQSTETLLRKHSGTVQRNVTTYTLYLQLLPAVSVPGRASSAPCHQHA